jgi:hypothetical protein
MVCTAEKLRMFSHKFDTYINQIFGDETVRDILSNSTSKPFIPGQNYVLLNNLMVS